MQSVKTVLHSMPDYCLGDCYYINIYQIYLLLFVLLCKKVVFDALLKSEVVFYLNLSTSCDHLSIFEPCDACRRWTLPWYTPEENSLSFSDCLVLRTEENILQTWNTHSVSIQCALNMLLNILSSTSGSIQNIYLSKSIDITDMVRRMLN